MIPELPEIIVIFVICVAIFGLGKLEDVGEVVWRLRCRLSPSLDPDAGDPKASQPTSSRTESKPDESHE